MRGNPAKLEFETPWYLWLTRRSSSDKGRKKRVHDGCTTRFTDLYNENAKYFYPLIQPSLHLHVVAARVGSGFGVVRRVGGPSRLAIETIAKRLRFWYYLGAFIYDVHKISKSFDPIPPLFLQNL